MKKIILFLLVIGVIVFAGYNYLYKDHRNIAGEKSEYEVEAAALAKAFLDKPDEATAKYIDKTLTLSGRVTESESGGVTLDNVAYCKFTEDSSEKAASGNKMADAQGGTNQIILPTPINIMAKKAAFLALTESFAVKNRKESCMFIIVISCLAKKNTNVPTNNNP